MAIMAIALAVLALSSTISANHPHSAEGPGTSVTMVSVIRTTNTRISTRSQWSIASVIPYSNLPVPTPSQRTTVSVIRPSISQVLTRSVLTLSQRTTVSVIRASNPQVSTWSQRTSVSVNRASNIQVSTWSHRTSVSVNRASNLQVPTSSPVGLTTSSISSTTSSVSLTTSSVGSTSSSVGLITISVVGPTTTLTPVIVIGISPATSTPTSTAHTGSGYLDGWYYAAITGGPPPNDVAGTGTCGFVSAEEVLALKCNTFSSCHVFTKQSVFGCCEPWDENNWANAYESATPTCGQLATQCYEEGHHSHSVQIGLYDLHCTNSRAPSCVTYLLTHSAEDTKTYSHFGCAATGTVENVQDYATTVSGRTVATAFAITAPDIEMAGTAISTTTKTGKAGKVDRKMPVLGAMGIALWMLRGL